MSRLSTKRRRDISRQRWQFLAVGVTIVVGVTMFSATYDSYRNLTASYEQTYERLHFADMTISGGDEFLAASVEAIDGVTAITVRHRADVPVSIGTTTLRGRLIGMPAGSQPEIGRLDLQSGRYLGAEGASEAVVEVHVARTFDLAPGDTVEVRVGDGARLSVVGIAASAEYIWPAPSAQEVFADPRQFGVLFVDDRAVARLPTDVVVRETLVGYADGADTATVDALVHDAALTAGATSIVTRADQPSNATLQLDVEGFGSMAIAFPALFLTAAGMAVYVLLTRIVFSQRSIIGTLRASGMGARTLRDHYLGYGIWIGLAASVVGVAVGVVVGSIMTEMYTGVLDIPDTVVAIRPVTVMIGIGFGVVAGALSAVIPARAAYRTEPAEAMRGTVPHTGGSRSLVERLVPPLARASVRTRMTLRGIGRSKRRSLATVVAVILSLVLILASGGMIDSMIRLIDRQFNELALEDASVVSAVGVTDDLVSEIASMPGVDVAEPVATFDASVTANGETLATTMRGFAADTVMHGWATPTGSLPPDGILAGGEITARLGLDIGDPITIALPAHDVAITMELVGLVDEPLGVPLYARSDAIAAALLRAGVEDPSAVMRLPNVTTAMVRLTPDASRDATLGAIRGLDGVVSVLDARTLYELVQQYLGLFYAFVGIMAVFGGMMAFALMFNIISVNTAERSPEFATLKASGMSDGMIARMIAGENLLLTALGVLPGVGIGILAAGAFLRLFDNDSFNLSLTIRPLTLAAAMLAMFVVAAMSIVPGIRAVRKLDIGAVVRERAV